MAIAKIAYDQLDEKTQAKIGDLLKQHPHYEEFLAKNRPVGVGEGEWAFLRASTWPDWVRPPFGKRSQPDPRGERVAKYHRGNDHFTNIYPLIGRGDEKLFAGRDLRPDPDKQDIVSALKQRLGEFTTANASGADQAVALCWLLHLVGDIHQPLHCTSLFSEVFKDGDKGGNAYGIRADGKKINLHAYWDNLPGREPRFGVEDAEHKAKTYALVQKVVGQLRDLQFARKQYPQLTKNTSFASWAEEGFELARTVAYGKLKADQIMVRNGMVPDNAGEVGEDYHQAALALARRQMALAGYRLADRLKLGLLQGSR